MYHHLRTDFLYGLYYETPPSTFDDREISPLLVQHASFWRTLHSMILNNHPQTVKKPDLIVPRNPSISYDPDYARPRPDVLWMDQLDIERMKNTHANFIADIQKIPLTHGPAYIPDTKGIVTTASESLLSILTVSLHMLRRTGSSLPVEVFLSQPSTHTHAVCSEVFPGLNAKCFYFSDIFTQAQTTVSLSTYQYKIFSILFSTFEDILFLDSDAWPVNNPDPLFHSLPFTNTGMILWPDFWYASESPYFFEIAKIKDPPTLDVRPATESGEIMYSKSKHGYGIMLATYYNYYGPDYYYLLQSQGGPGQGDKETFPWAAVAMDEQFYSVNHPVTSLGRHDTNGEWLGSGMIQYDPVHDFFASTQQPAITPVNGGTKSRRIETKPLFIHANFPKYDPATIFNDDIHGIRSPVRDSNGTYVRCWFPLEENMSFFGFDLERRFWTAMQDTACGAAMGLWTGQERATKARIQEARGRDERVCAKVKEYVSLVFDSEHNEIQTQ